MRGIETRQVAYLRDLAGKVDLVIGDLIIIEVLQGCRTPQEFDLALSRFEDLIQLQISTHDLAIAAARNYRILRAKGVTVRKTIDTLIATRCIRDGLALLYSDRDFDPFVEHLGLIPALDPASGVN